MMRRRRRATRRLAADSELLLAAMVDMMVNVLLFLLTLYGAGPRAGADEIELPEARARDPLSGNVHLTITPHLVAIDGNQVLKMDAGPDGPRLPTDGPAFDAIQTQLGTWGSGGAAPPLTVEIDRRVPWSVVRPLLGLAAAAGYTDLRFSVASVEGGPG